MSANLHESLTNLVGPGLTRNASALLDEHEYGVGRAMHASLSVILSGLERNAGDAGLMSEVAKLVGDRTNDPSQLSNLATIVKQGANSATSALGDKLLSLLFANRKEAINSAVARASGIGGQSSAHLMPIAAGMVLAQLGKRFGPGVPPQTAIAGAIAGDRTTIIKAVPNYLSRLIPLGRGSTTLETAAMKPAAGPAGSKRDENGGSLAWLLLPLLVLGGLVLFFLNQQATEEPREAAAPPPPVASSDGGSTTSRPDYRYDYAPSSSRPAAEPAKAPPIAGLTRLTLPNGIDVDHVPGGVEPRMIDFIGDRWSFIDKTKWFDFDRVRFVTGSSQLTPGSRAQLRNVAKILQAYPNVAIKIGGYTDNVGDPQTNLRLSTDRAKRVMEELVRLGVSADRLEAEGYGDLHPIADNSTAEGRAKNRRTALSIRAK